MIPKKKCSICRIWPAELPDRERGGRPIKRICFECHKERLMGDVRAILYNKQRTED